MYHIDNDYCRFSDGSLHGIIVLMARIFSADRAVEGGQLTTSSEGLDCVRERLDWQVDEQEERLSVLRCSGLKA